MKGELHHHTASYRDNMLAQGDNYFFSFKSKINKYNSINNRVIKNAITNKKSTFIMVEESMKNTNHTINMPHAIKMLPNTNVISKK